uniref:Uncharacterized protein n=1 Tax=Rhizophora mucronata TaxID=61149 RepID=A0A2P2P057_RHIMU
MWLMHQPQKQNMRLFLQSTIILLLRPQPRNPNTKRSCLQLQHLNLQRMTSLR